VAGYCEAAGSILAGSILAGSVIAGSIIAGSIIAGSIIAGSIIAVSTIAGSIITGSILASIITDSLIARQPLQVIFTLKCPYTQCLHVKTLYPQISDNTYLLLICITPYHTMLSYNTILAIVKCELCQ